MIPATSEAQSLQQIQPLLPCFHCSLKIANIFMYYDNVISSFIFFIMSLSLVEYVLYCDVKPSLCIVPHNVDIVKCILCTLSTNFTLRNVKCLCTCVRVSLRGPVELWDVFDVESGHKLLPHLPSQPVAKHSGSRLNLDQLGHDFDLQLSLRS